MKQGYNNLRISGPSLLGLIGLCLALSACDKIQALSRNENGKAFLNSQIPPDLAPKYFPPSGFVFSAFRTRGLPEARYGVASPPINPRAQVLILVEADYPAEAYFGIMRDLLEGGYSVWLLEIPGQGGAGRYKQQHEAIDTPDYHDGINVINDFINTVIAPSPEKPLYILGSGVSATQGLMVYKSAPAERIKAVFAYEPYTGTTLTRGELWHRQDVIETKLGQIGQSWQVYNPDLRLKAKSDQWIAAQQNIIKALKAPNLPQINLNQRPANQVWVFTPEAASQEHRRTLKQFCASVTSCTLESVDSANDIGLETVERLKALDKSAVP